MPRDRREPAEKAPNFVYFGPSIVAAANRKLQPAYGAARYTVYYVDGGEYGEHLVEIADWSQVAKITWRRVDVGRAIGIAILREWQLALSDHDACVKEDAIATVIADVPAFHSITPDDIKRIARFGALAMDQRLREEGAFEDAI